MRPEDGNSYTTVDKNLVLAKKSTKNIKHPNRTVINPQAFVKTMINSNIAIFFYTIYRALKLQYRPALIPRHLTEGTVGAAGKLVSSVLTQVSVAFLSNWLEFPVSTLGGVDPVQKLTMMSLSAETYLDAIKQFVLDMTSGQRTKQAYYPTMHINALVIDCKVASAYNGQARINLYVVNLVFGTDTPNVQCHDIITDCTTYYQMGVLVRVEPGTKDELPGFQ